VRDSVANGICGKINKDPYTYEICCILKSENNNRRRFITDFWSLNTLTGCIFPRRENMISMQMSCVLTNGGSVRSKLLTHAYVTNVCEETRQNMRASALESRIYK